MWWVVEWLSASLLLAIKTKDNRIEQRAERKDLRLKRKSYYGRRWVHHKLCQYELTRPCLRSSQKQLWLSVHVKEITNHKKENRWKNVGMKKVRADKTTISLLSLPPFIIWETVKMALHLLEVKSRSQEVGSLGILGRPCVGYFRHDDLVPECIAHQWRVSATALVH
jgi:hypothetical protein